MLPECLCCVVHLRMPCAAEKLRIQRFPTSLIDLKMPEPTAEAAGHAGKAEYWLRHQRRIHAISLFIVGR